MNVRPTSEDQRVRVNDDRDEPGRYPASPPQTPVGLKVIPDLAPRLPYLKVRPVPEVGGRASEAVPAPAFESRVIPADELDRSRFHYSNVSLDQFRTQGQLQRFREPPYGSAPISPGPQTLRRLPA